MKDCEIKTVFLVLKGVVIENYSDFKLSRGIGSIVTPLSLVKGQTSLCTIITQSPSKLLCLPIEVFLPVLYDNLRFETEIYKSAFRAAVRFEGKDVRLAQFSDRKLRIIAARADFVKLNIRETLFLDHGGYLYSGDLSIDLTASRSKRASMVLVRSESMNIDLDDVFESGKMLKSGIAVKANKFSILLAFTESLFDNSVEEGVRESRIVTENIT